MMKFYIVLFTLLSLHSFSQNDAITRYVSTPRKDFIGCVSTLQIKRTRFNKNRDNIDTIVMKSRLDFTKTGNISMMTEFDYLNDIWQKVNYTPEGKIQTIYRRRNDTLSLFAEQFFSKSRIYPDIVNIYWNKKKVVEQYLNYFDSNNLLNKQEYLSVDTLRSYNTYLYDNNKRLIRDNFYNTKNGFGTTFDKSFTGNVTVKELYPNDSTIYRYLVNKDTAITIKNRRGFSSEIIIKNYESKDYSLIIEERYDREHLDSKFYKYSYKQKDSIVETSYNYTKDNELSFTYSTITTPKSIKSIRKTEGYDPSETIENTLIETEYDLYGNWTRKSFIKDNRTIEVIERTILYYCH